ncbi:MAG: solute-binding protein [Anaerolineales bacterium]|nr:solute-binding protein [Anaerolineales bacterium]
MRNKLLNGLHDILTNWRHRSIWIGIAALLLLVVYYGGQSILMRLRDPDRLIVYAFSTQQEVLEQHIFPAFEQDWEVKTGRNLKIQGVFGSSGRIAEQIILGAPADVVLLSNQQHVNWLKAGRRISPEIQPILISTTPMVIVTREGNPHGLAEYQDLSQPDLRLIHADPSSSGAGFCALFAEYGSAVYPSGTREEGEDQIRAIWRNVRFLAPSARETLTLFELGAGDAFATYEQDALLAQSRGIALEIVIPSVTAIAKHVAVTVDKNLTPSEVPLAEAFISYLISRSGQESYQRYYFRPAHFESRNFPALQDSLDVELLGGWSQAYEMLVNEFWRAEIEPHLHLNTAAEPLGE